MKKIRRSRICLRLTPLVILLLAVVLFSGCAATPLPGGMTRHRAGLAYSEGAFSANVRGQLTRTEADGYEGRVADSLTGQPRDFAATVAVSEPGTDGRTVQVVYTEPASLAGLTVTARPAVPGSGELQITVALDDLSLTVSAEDGRFDRLLAPARVLLAQGDITAIGRDEAGARTVTVQSAENVCILCSFPDDGDRPALFRSESDSYEMTLRVTWTS